MSILNAVLYHIFMLESHLTQWPYMEKKCNLTCMVELTKFIIKSRRQILKWRFMVLEIIKHFLFSWDKEICLGVWKTARKDLDY